MPEGCDLGIPRERYLWWVHVRVDGVLSPVEVPSRHGVLIIPLRRYPVRSPLKTGMS
jgi:hypothetical protein